jgi:hypothetical protein
MMLNRFKQYALTQLKLSLTKTFDYLIDNSWTAYVFPGSFDFAVKQKLRNTDDLSRYDLAVFMGYSHYMQVEAEKAFPVYAKIYAAIKAKQLLAFLIEVNNNPHEHLVQEVDPVLKGSHLYLQPYLSECSCINGTFDRLLNTRRLEIETLIISQTKKDFTHLGRELVYLSLGSGSLLQDLFNVMKLIQLGFKNISIHLVDTAYQSNLDEDFTTFTAVHQFKQILTALASENSFKYSMRTYSSLTDFENYHPNKKIDIVSAIDFDECDLGLESVLKVIQLLSENGKFYLSYHSYDLMFSRTHCIYLRNSVPDAIHPLLVKLFDNFENCLHARSLHQTPIRIAVNALIIAKSLLWYELIPRMHTHKSITLKIFTSTSADPTMTATHQELTTQYAKLFIPQETSLDIQFFTDEVALLSNQENAILISDDVVISHI